MKKQRFKVGDRVARTSNQSTGKVVEAKFQEQITVGNKNRTVTFPEQWKYRIKGQDFSPRHWLWDSIVESAEPCPNCNSIGWDWVSGCNKCGLSPEDGE